MNLSKFKNKKLVLLILLILIMLIVIYGIIHIYAIFHSELDGNIELEKGIWNIEVNNTDITNETLKEFTIDTIDMETNEHVKNGKLAPGMKGSFKIGINPKNTNVSVKYEISLNEKQMANSSIKINSIKEIEQNNELIKTGENSYTGIISLDNIKKNIKNNIKVEIEWVDDRENDKLDEKIGSVYNSKIQIPITVHVSQYFGETIDEYVEN